MRTTSIGRRLALLIAAGVFAAASAGRAGEGGPGVAGPLPEAAARGLQPVVVIDREDIELSGARNLWDLVASRSKFNAFGLHRPLRFPAWPLYATGGVRVTVLVNGRRVSDSTYDLDAIPISAVERIEVLHDSAIGAHGPQAVAGAINIVLRNRFEGAEVEIGGERPRGAGGDAEQASAIWGGAVGAGRLTVGADIFRREEIRSADRDYSRALWTPGGSFADTRGVSIYGNTAVVFPATREDDFQILPIGECAGSAYAGPLADPFGLGGAGCGFAWADVAWSFERREQRSAFLSVEHPAGEDWTVYADMRASTGDFAPLHWAPSPGQIGLPLDYALSDGQGALPAGTLVFHRFAGHGDRSFDSESREYDLTFGSRGQFASGVGFDAYLRFHRRQVDTIGSGLVRRSAVLREIARAGSGAGGGYDLENALSRDPGHLAAIRRTSVRLEDTDATEHRAARIAFDGEAFDLDGGPARWAAGAEFVRESRLWDVDYRDGQGGAVPQTDVIGLLTLASEGARDRVSGFVETALPVTGNWDIGLAGRVDEHDDVDRTASAQVATGYRVGETLTFRASAARVEKPPFLAALHLAPVVVAGRIRDPALGGASYQVLSRNFGNPEIGPDRADNIGFGVAGDFGALSASADWYRTKLSRIMAVVPTQMAIDHAHLHGAPPGNTVIHRNAAGLITRVDKPLLGDGEAETSGINLRARWAAETDWADLELDLYWNYTAKYEFRALDLRVPRDFPSHRGHVALRAERDGVTAQWTVYGRSGYRAAGGGFERWMGHDLSLRWRNPFGVEGVDLVGGVFNILDRDPPINSNDPDYPDESLDSIRGRTLFARARMKL